MRRLLLVPLGIACTAVYHQRYRLGALPQVSKSRTTSSSSSSVAKRAKSKTIRVSSNVKRRRSVSTRNDTHQATGTSTTTNAFEEHYRATYRSMMLLKERPPKFVVFRMSPTSGLGFGNRVRSLSGAMFLAALTDRVLLLDESGPLRLSSQPRTFRHLFRPPVVGGVVLDWSAGLDGAGLCGNANVSAAIARSPNELLDDFGARFDDRADCIVITAGHGHDRQVASRNEVRYGDRVMRLFGGTSRLEWSRLTLGLLMQRPDPAIAEAAASLGKRLGLDAVPASHRIAVQYRTFADVTTSKMWLADATEKFWKCTLNLVSERIIDLRKEYPSRSSANVTVFFSSDRQEMKDMARQRLRGAFPGLAVVSSDLPITHSGGALGPMKRAKGGHGVSPYVDWFLIGECATLIASGASSFAITAFFRPMTGSVGRSNIKKRLFTVDNIGGAVGHNPQCGEVRPRGYNDLNFGYQDTPAAVQVAKSPSNQEVRVEGGESSDAKSLLVLSYSLYGSTPKYVRGMIETAKVARQVYHGWQVRVYHDTTVPPGGLSELSELTNVRLINVTADRRDWVVRTVNPRSWRFLVASDPSVRAYAVRDSDSKPSVREKAAVDEWLGSGTAFHVMRDHPAHDPTKDPMLAGMWGGLRRAVPNMDAALREYYGAKSGGFSYEDDQDFLRQKIFHLAKDDSLQHDSYFCVNTGGIAFPVTREQSGDPNDFVGRQQMVLGKKVVPVLKDPMLKDKLFLKMYNDCVSRRASQLSNSTRNVPSSDTSYGGKQIGASMKLSAKDGGGDRGRRFTGKLRGNRSQ